jgi:YfiH family protein
LTTDERLLPGAVPRWEVPEWRERFGVVAGITGRGSGPEPFDLGLASAAPVGEVMARWRAFRSSIPECPAQVIASQVHGDHLLWHDAPPAGWTIHDGADGHATATEGLLLLVTVADCVPVYLLAPRTRTIALLHAGWRGTAAGILAKGVRLLTDRGGARPDELVMHLGVAISGPCYEVGAEVMDGVGKARPGPGPWHLDLRETLEGQAAELGVRNVSRSGHCSAREADHFFSHRRSGGRDGRMVAYLGLIPG